MPGTFLNFPFDEELFLMQWQAAQDPVITALLNSGALVEDATIRGLIRNGSNLYTISGLSDLGIDPEAPSVNNGYYPQQRVLSAGVSLTF